MALLTADDVLNKKFQSVKFREGYDQIEVDEFLDEVVATIYSLTVENNELKEQLAASAQRIEELSSGEAVAPAPQPVVVEEAVVEEVPEAEPEPVPYVEEPAAVAPANAAGETQTATSMLSLAQRLHDEYIDDGKAEAQKIIGDANARAEEIVAGANNQRDEILAQLASEQGGLEESINQLREFEGDYRKAISEHLQGLLQQVNADVKGE